MDTTAKLLEAAEKRMRQGGYNAVSFRDLAQDTGIKSSSVHYHFPKKEDLGHALIERYTNNFFTALETTTQNAKTVKEKLRGYTRVYRDALTGSDAICLCGLLGAEVGGLPSSLAENIQNFFRANTQWLEETLAEAGSKTKQAEAANLLATHQGAMMLSKAMNDINLFDTITSLAVEKALKRD